MEHMNININAGLVLMHDYYVCTHSVCKELTHIIVSHTCANKVFHARYTRTPTNLITLHANCEAECAKHIERVWQNAFDTVHQCVDFALFKLAEARRFTF